MSVRSIGSYLGTEILEIALAGEGITAAIWTFGATLADLVVQNGAGQGVPVVMGYRNVDDLVAGRSFNGVVAGRCANRIARGRFAIDGVDYQLTLNENGRTHLHGGANSFGLRPWQLMHADAASVALRLQARDGEDGYPGNVTVDLAYAIEAPLTLAMTITATTDAPTPVNLAGHAYFNLDGAGTTAGQRLTLPASRYTPVDAELIPTGELASVEGTHLDFRGGRPLTPGSEPRIDHNLVLDRNGEGLALAARLEGARSGLAMELLSTEPAVQVYDGAGLNPGFATRHGAPLVPFAGICLEAQHYPDAPNHPQFPDVILRPGMTYRQVTKWRFDKR